MTRAIAQAEGFSAWLGSKPFQLGLAQLRKFQLELITMYIYVMVRTV